MEERAIGEISKKYRFHLGYLSDRKFYVMFQFNGAKSDFVKFMQYVLNSYNNAKDFILENTETGVVYDAYKMATETYGLKKQTFEEKMANA